MEHGHYIVGASAAGITHILHRGQLCNIQAIIS